MNEQYENHLDQMFNALSDRTRRTILMDLTQGPLSISKLGEQFNLTKQAISKHVKVLEKAGLIHKEKNGRIQRCQFNMENFIIMQRTLEKYSQFWNQQLDILENYIEQVKKSGG